MKKRKLMRTLLAALCASMLISAMSVTAIADDDVVLDDDDEEVVLDDELDVMYGATYVNGATSQPSVTTSPTDPDNPDTGTTGSDPTEPDEPNPPHQCKYEVVREPSCTETGLMEYKIINCSVCIAQDFPPIILDPRGHTEENAYDTTKAPTCSTSGKIVHHCGRCDAEMSSEDDPDQPATGKHTISAPTSETKADCTHGATATGICDECKKEVTITTSEPDLEAHNVPNPETTLKPTCLADGKAKGKCSICQKEITITLPKNDDDASHSWDKGTETEKPTEEKDGKKTYTCTLCKITKEEPILKLKHEFSEDWSSDETGHWHKCPNCDRTDGFSGHTWNDGKCSICEYGCEHNYVAEKAPVIVYCDKPYTYTVTARCSKCSATRKYNGTNPAAGHDWGAKDENDVAKCSRCNVEAILDSNGNIVRILAEGEDVGREEEIVIKLPELEPEPDPDETKSDDKPEEKTEDKPEEKAEEKPEAKPSDDKQTSSDKPKEDKPKNTTSKPSDNPNSGVTMAILPLAVAAAIVIFKKKG